MHAQSTFLSLQAIPRQQPALFRAFRASKSSQKVQPSGLSAAARDARRWHSASASAGRSGGIGSSLLSRRADSSAGRALHGAGTCAGASLFQLANAEAIYEPTGVPLVDELMKLPSMDAAVHRSMQLLGFLAAVALLGGLLLRVLDAAAGRRLRAAGQTGFNAGAAAVASAYRPCKVMLPLYCATRAATVVLALAEVAATKLNLDPASLLLCGLDGRLMATLQWCTLAAGAGNKQAAMLPALEWLTQLVQDCSELVLIVALAWTAMNFKSRLIAWQALCIQLDNDPHNDGAVPLLRLLSSGLSVLIVLAALGITLIGFGFHIGPLMASVGGVGVVVGLATQGLLANLVAAVSLFVTRPFVTGDQVQLINPEGVEVEGTVLNIEPTRTILQNSDSGCIIHITNSDVSQFIIKNYTQNRNLARLRELQAAGELDPAGTGTSSSTAATGTSALRSLPGWARVLRSSDDSGTRAGTAGGTAGTAGGSEEEGPKGGLAGGWVAA